MGRIVHVIPDLAMGGAERVCGELAIAQAKRADVSVIVIGGLSGSAVESGVATHLSLLHLDKGVGFSIRHAFKLGMLIRRLSPTVVHSHRHTLKYLLIAILATAPRARYVHTLHNDPWKEAGRVDRILQRALFKSRRVLPVALSPDLARRSAEYYGLRNVPSVPNGVPVPAKARTSPSHRAAHVVSIGRMVPQKDPLLLISAIHELHKSGRLEGVKVTVVGDGPLRPKVEDAVADFALGEVIRLPGNVPDAREVLQDADVFVLSSAWEGLPVAALEAMAEAVPVVSTTVGGMVDLLGSGAGVLVPPNDKTALAEAIHTLARDPALRDRIGWLGHEKVEQEYSTRAMESAYAAIYGNHTAGRKS